MRAQQAAQVLVLFQFPGARSEGVYTGKIFEYLAARRPVILIGGEKSVLTSLLEETGAGAHAPDDAAIQARLSQHWEEFQAKRTILTHFSREMLPMADKVPEECAHDGLVVEI